MSRSTPEGKFKEVLTNRLNNLFPGCYIMKQQRQGMPDYFILYKDKWAFLEVKASRTAEKQPNQEYYVDAFGEMSYAAFVYPENLELILDELQLAFGTRGAARLSERKQRTLD